MITTINFHLIKACNFACKYCYATFNDISQKSLSKHQQIALLEELSKENIFKKINFAGGEPTLVPHIRELIRYAKGLGFETSIVTNASKIDFEWIKSVKDSLDILTVSLDSSDKNTNILSGRSKQEYTVQNDQILSIATACHLFGIKLKINTVVSSFNKDEILAPFINMLKPFRWKILQATKIEGQNDAAYDEVKIPLAAFSNYCKRNNELILPEIKVIEESAEIIQGSYLMIDQLGRFYDSNSGKHSYSDRILTIGVANALKQVELDYQKFTQREGNYSVIELMEA